MGSSARRVAGLLVALTTAAAWAIGSATPCVAAPEDSSTDNSSPNAASTSVLPVVGVLDGMWNEYVAPNAPVAPSQVGAFEQMIPTSTQVGDFFAFIQQFRGAAPIGPPIG